MVKVWKMSKVTVQWTHWGKGPGDGAVASDMSSHSLHQWVMMETGRAAWPLRLYVHHPASFQFRPTAYVEYATAKTWIHAPVSSSWGWESIVDASVLWWLTVTHLSVGARKTFNTRWCHLLQRYLSVNSDLNICAVVKTAQSRSLLALFCPACLEIWSTAGRN